MVDRVLASCFAGSHHDLVHLAMTPMQSFSGLMEWILGNSNQLPVYVSIGKQLSTFLLPETQYWSD